MTCCNAGDQPEGREKESEDGAMTTLFGFYVYVGVLHVIISEGWRPWHFLFWWPLEYVFAWLERKS
jgi:hypothetical protein